MSKSFVAALHNSVSKVVSISRAGIRRVDYEAVIRDLAAVAEVDEGVAVGIE